MKTDYEIEKLIFRDIYFEYVNRIEALIVSGLKPSHDLFAYAGKLGKMAELPHEVLKGLQLLKDNIYYFGGMIANIKHEPDKQA